MTRHPTPIHARPIDAAGHHVPSESCPCGVILAASMTEPGQVVYVHRHNAPGPPDAPPPDADRLIWRSRERQEAPPTGGHASTGMRPDAQTTGLPFHTHPVTMQEPDL